MSADAKMLPVLIVGAGPTGLTLALSLKQQGINFRIIDKAASPTSISKAIVIHARTLELLENLGVVEPFIKAGMPIHGMNVFAEGKRVVHLNMDEIESPYKFILSISQAKTEEILGQEFAKIGGQVERSIELVGFSQKNGVVTASLKNHSNDTIEELECRYLVGADGAHSLVRKSLGLTFEGQPYEEAFGAADVFCQSSMSEDEGYAFLGEDGVMAVFPFGEGRYRIIFDLIENKLDGKEVDTSSELTMDTVLSVVAKRGPADMKVSDPHWLAWFKVNRRFANHQRVDNVFIAGDASHIHSPVGGVGMNTGMQDAINLAWKLALVVSGLADEWLLATYEEERHKVAQAVLKGTHLATRFVTLRSPVAKAIRNNLMHFLSSQEIVQQRILRAGSLTGVSYRTSSLSAECHPPLEKSVEKSLGKLKHSLYSENEDERPGISSWIDFTRAPVAGDRALDATFKDEAGAEMHLSKRIAGNNFKLLLFDGFVASDEGYEGFSRIAKVLKEKYDRLVDVHVVVPFAPGKNKLPAYDSVIYDSERTLHKLYGASSEALYLIRPDGYIAFRSQPASLEELISYFEAIRLRSLKAVQA